MAFILRGPIFFIYTKPKVVFGLQNFKYLRKIPSIFLRPINGILPHFTYKSRRFDLMPNQAKVQNKEKTNQRHNVSLLNIIA
jgi:hypothetical protein